MVNSNNLIIKINYQAKNRQLYSSVQRDMITEWHTKRIFLAIIMIFIIILISNKVFKYENELISVEKSAKDIKKEVIDVSNLSIKNNPVRVIKKPETNIKSVKYVISDEVSVDKIIVRALLTSELIDKEPIDTITSPVIVNKNYAAKLYYFTEITNLKGQDLYHLWLLNDIAIFKRKIKILGNRWRASTSKFIPYSKAGLWKARLINSEDYILNEIQFYVIQE